MTVYFNLIEMLSRVVRIEAGLLTYTAGFCNLYFFYLKVRESCSSADSIRHLALSEHRH